MKMGILGGTFNPIHNAHLQLAKEACDFAGLDEVCFIPSGCSYLKNTSEILPGEIRREMVESAISEFPAFSLSEIELNRPGNSYTCDTITELHHLYPDRELYLIMGADNLFDLEKWKNPEVIFRYVHILASARGNKSRMDIMYKMYELAEKYCASIALLPVHYMNISSTQIRNAIEKGEDISSFVPKSVELYIKKKGLYQCQKKKT